MPVNFTPPGGEDYIRILPEIIMTVIGTLISDILLIWVDPRIRLEE